METALKALEWAVTQLQTNPLILVLLLSWVTIFGLVREIRVLYHKLIDGANDENKRLQEQMAKNIGTDNKVIAEVTSVLGMFQQWQKMQKPDDR